MAKNLISTIIAHEYLTRVKKKSFLILTFVAPILFVLLCSIPAIIMVATKEEGKKIAVADKSGIVMPLLENTENAVYEDYSSMSVDSLKNKIEELGIDGIVYISGIDTLTKTVQVSTYSYKPFGMDLVSSLENVVNSAVEDYRIKSYKIDNLSKIMEDVKSDISITTYTLDDKGGEKVSASEVNMFISMAMGMIIYMFIAMFCGMVMSSIIEEKSSRVVEVIISSVSSTQLMFGKIIGVALVAFTQFFLWVVFTGLILMGVSFFFGSEFISAGTSVAADPAIMGMTPDMSKAMENNGMAVVLQTLAGLNYTQIFLSFIVFFLFGYLMYASLFAAIGSAVENEADTQQLQLPITIPLMIGFFISLYAYKAPDSAIVFWGSMIPFTSPIVMLARIPFGVPAWQLILSISILILTFVFMAWISAKIYKIGILMFGKKTSFKDLYKWLRMK